MLNVRGMLQAACSLGLASWKVVKGLKGSTDTVSGARRARGCQQCCWVCNRVNSSAHG